MLITILVKSRDTLDGTPEEEVAFEAIDVWDFGEVLIQAWGDWWGGG